MFLKFDVQYFIPNSLIASFLSSLCSTFCFVKGRVTCGSGERNIKILLAFWKSPRFSLTLPLSQPRKKSSGPVLLSVVSPVTIE